MASIALMWMVVVLDLDDLTDAAVRFDWETQSDKCGFMNGLID